MNRSDTTSSLAVCTFPMMKTKWMRRKGQRREDIMHECERNIGMTARDNERDDGKIERKGCNGGVGDGCQMIPRYQRHCRHHQGEE